MNKRSTCLGVMPEPLYFLVAWLALRCVYNSVNCLAIICSPSIVVIVFLERDITSESHGTPVHISIIVYTVHLYCFYLLSIAITITISTLVFWPFVNNKTGEIDNLSDSLGAKLFAFVCRSRSSKQPLGCKRRHCLLCHLLVVLGVLLVR